MTGRSNKGTHARKYDQLLSVSEMPGARPVQQYSSRGYTDPAEDLPTVGMLVGTGLIGGIGTSVLVMIYQDPGADVYGLHVLAIMVIAILFDSLAAAMYIRFIVHYGALSLRDVMEAIYAPRNEMLYYVGQLDERKMEFIEKNRLIRRVSLVELTGYRDIVQTPFGDLDPEWVGEYLNKIMDKWPEFEPVRYQGDGFESRRNKEIFEKWMEMWNLAQRTPGHITTWTASKEEVLKKLEYFEEEP
jgi:hypothetical protein